MDRTIRKTAWALCIYNILFLVMSIVAEIIVCFSNNEGLIGNKELIVSLSAVISGLIYVLIYIKREMNFSEIFQKNKDHRISLKNICVIISIMIVFQMITAIGNGLMETVLNMFGLSIAGEISSATCEEVSFPMIIYIVFLGPVTEEVVFRGMIMRSLSKYGRVFAILASAILFGIYHGNVSQMVFAAVLGIMFAYIAMEYSILTSIVIHIMNNAFSFGMSFVADQLNSPIIDLVFIAVILLSVIISIVFLIRKWKLIRKYILENQTCKGAWRCLITSLGAVIFTLINLGFAYYGVIS